MSAKKPYTAIHIDVFNEKISIVKVQRLEDLQFLVRGIIDPVRVDDDVIMFINEEGRHDHPNVGYFFGNLTICGSGVLVNSEEYSDVPEDYLPAAIGMVKFWDRRTDEEKSA